MGDRLLDTAASISQAASALLDRCKALGVKIATAESCTGGMVAAALTDIAGSSAVVDRGWVTYSNTAKTQELAVPPSLLDQWGAVSEPVARAMAEGALAGSQTDLTVAITGIAGPDGGSIDKPVGLVHFAVARRGQPTVAYHTVFAGDRTAVRASATQTALALLTQALL